MFVARILYPVTVLGPGRRVGIWMAGCRHACKGCSNPELWEFHPVYRTSVKVIGRLIRDIRRVNPIDGFTVTGGEPFEQVVELGGLLDEVRHISDDILIYSGYTKEELDGKKEPAIHHVLEQAAVLIDGRYEEEKNDGSAMRGSCNQRIHILKEAFQGSYERYLADYKNEIENFMSADGMISVGIHRPGFREELAEGMKKEGLEAL